MGSGEPGSRRHRKPGSQRSGEKGEDKEGGDGMDWEEGGLEKGGDRMGEELYTSKLNL